MTGTGFLFILITIVCLYFIRNHLDPVLRFLFPHRINHKKLDNFPKPDADLTKKLEESGFEFLGTRSEAIFLLWSHRFSVFIREGRITADIPPTSNMRGGYLATFWENGGCAMTRVGSTRTVSGDDYISRGVPSMSTITNLLAEHYKTETSLEKDEDPTTIDSVEKRIESAKKWYIRNGRTEMARAAVLGAILAASFIAFWVYALIMLYY